MNITKPHPRKRLRVHATTDDGRPLCGGGHQAKAASAWQTDLAAVTCERCRAIEQNRATPPPSLY